MKTKGKLGLNSPDGLMLLAAVSGFVGVAMGAFGAHGLKGKLAADLMAAFHTAVQYQLWHTVAVLAVAVHWRHCPNSRLAGWSAAAMLAGIVLFSGSLFLLSLTEQRGLGVITPVGGVLLLVGWFLLAVDRFLGMRDGGR